MATANAIAKPTNHSTMLHHKSVGSGPPVILLPGMLGTLESEWDSYLKPIADLGYTAIGLDLPGHGHSDMTKSLTLRVIVEEIDNFLKSIKAEPAVFIGYSLGGYAALQYALKNPNRVVGLWMHAVKFAWSGEEAENMAETLTVEYLQENKPEWYEELSAMHGDKLEQILPWLAKLTVNLPDTGLTEFDIEEVAFPVMVSVGDRDQLIPLNEAVDLYKAFRNGQLSVLADTFHPIGSVRSQVMIPMIKDFLNRIG